MTEHEKLKCVCDKIGYEYHRLKAVLPELVCWEENEFGIINIEINPREIIFTPEFMGKYTEYYLCIDDFVNVNSMELWLMKNLENPVGYLYNLIK